MLTLADYRGEMGSLVVVTWKILIKFSIHYGIAKVIWQIDLAFSHHS